MSDAADGRVVSDADLRPRLGMVVLEGVLILAGAFYIGAYLWIGAHRLTYPFDVEWMEGACVDHVVRILAGRGLYTRPTIDFIPFFYPPLYFYVSAALARVIGVGFLPLRLVSLVSSLVLFAFTYGLVRRETGNRMAGWVAVAAFAATYRVGGAWLDLARVDALFLMLVVAGAYTLRFGTAAYSWPLAGLLLALAALTKQTAAFIAAPLAVYAIGRDWRRGLTFAAAFIAVLGGATLLLDWITHGWYLAYVLYLPGRIQTLGDIPPAIWQRSIFGPLPIAFGMSTAYLITRLGRRDHTGLFYGLLLAALVAAAWASGRHSGAYDNVLIPAHLALAIGMALAFADWAQTAGGRHGATETYGATLVAIQLLMLVYPVAAQVPSTGDVAVARRLQHWVASTPGDIFSPHHGFVGGPAGRPTTAHTWAMFDLLRVSSPETAAELARGVHDAFAQHRFGVILVDKIEPWFEADLDRYYVRRGPALEGQALWTRTGYLTTPRWIYTPKEPPLTRPAGP
jgi:hypothetical protein